jgi:peptide/nickel transport system substrate-binding protein
MRFRAPAGLTILGGTMRSFERIRWVLCAGLLLASAACTRGKEKAAPTGTGPSAPVTVVVPGQSGTGTGMDSGSGSDWDEGRLPAALMQGEPRQGGEVTVRIPIEPPSLNTLVDSDWWAARMTEHNLYESLIDIDAYDEPEFKPTPELAERWEVSEDQLTYTFFLRKGVTWHDGQPFSAKDVIATFDKVQNPGTKCAHVRSFLEELESYVAIDDFTVRFKWKRPYFLTLDSFADVQIQPAHVIGKLTPAQYNEAATNPINRAPVGTGPFKFVEWQANQKIVFARNDAYWGPKAHLERLVFRPVPDETVAEQLAERGELDVFNQPGEEQWVAMAKNAKLREQFNRARAFDANYAWIGWNVSRPMFADKRLRRAMTLLIDRPGLIGKILHGLPRPTTCHFYYKAPECDPAQTPLPFDPVEGVRLLDEAGWKDSDGDGIRDKGGVPFRFTFMIPSSSVNAGRMATLMKDQFGRAGIDMAIQKVEWSAFSKRLRTHEFDACTLLWGSGPRSDPTQIWHSKSVEGGSNYIGYKNPKVDSLLEQARVSFDPAARTALYREFGAILHDEQPYTFLYIRPRLALVHAKLRGVKDTLMSWQYRDWWIEERAAR